MSNKKYAVNVKTKTELKALMIELERRGLRWCNGSKPTDDNGLAIDTYGSQTCVALTDRFGYGSKPFYKKEGYTVLSFSEYAEITGIKVLPEPTKLTIAEIEDLLGYAVEVVS